MHACLPNSRPTHVFLLSLQWLLPAPLSVLRSLPPSPPQNRPLLEKTESAPFASTRRWTRSSTPVDTCVCATTVGWSWRDRSMRAVRYAGGQSKTLSKRTGRDGPDVKNRCSDFHCWMPPVFPSQAWLDTDLGPNRRLATPGHNCAYISILYGWIASGERLGSSYTEVRWSSS